VDDPRLTLSCDPQRAEKWQVSAHGRSFRHPQVPHRSSADDDLPGQRTSPLTLRCPFLSRVPQVRIPLEGVGWSAWALTVGILRRGRVPGTAQHLGCL
jgi:hypothetical protein